MIEKAKENTIEIVFNKNIVEFFLTDIERYNSIFLYQNLTEIKRRTELWMKC